MSRPSDWTPLDWHEDPVPGTPYVIEDGAAQMAVVATTIADAARNLREIASVEGQVSLAVDAFRERAREAASQIELVRERYARTSEALAAYVEPLREAQQWSQDALTAATSAREDLLQAEADAYTASQELSYAIDETGRQSAEEALTAAHGRVTTAESSLSDARTLLYSAIDHRDAAAETAMGLIDGAMEINDLNDSAWRQFLNKNAELLDALATALAVIGAVLAVVAMLVPGLNLLVLGLALGIGAAAINFALAENGNKGWEDFAMDVFGLATLGAGRLLTSALRGARAARATQVANNRANVLAGPPARAGRTPRGRRPNHGRGANRARQERMERGRAQQRAEHARMTSAPEVSLRNPRSLVDAARHNVATNGWRNVLLSGGDDAYEMAYNNTLRAPGMGGGRAAAELDRIAIVIGGVDNAGTAMAVGDLFSVSNPVASWGGSVIDSVVPDQPRQDDVQAVR